ncbi:MAG TPA: hypothetical protein PLE19_11220 [Planctomycetota bacterium]|nr:hypothetical protein [Planctomycetota bacterium]HRR78992.1 hypothetical protein [Planctomycetota bacterium]HRT93440.1 hypothetical protein [Planctomycetota bacterium]
MSPILKLNHDDPDKELAFELDFQLSLTTRQRFRRMIQRSDEVKRMLLRYGHQEPVETVRRECR